jgi:hypothetical protein
MKCSRQDQSFPFSSLTQTQENYTNFERETETDREIQKDIFVCKEFPYMIMGLISLKFVVQFISLGIWLTVDVAILNLKSVEKADFLCYSLEAEFLLHLEISVFALKTFNC